MNRQEFPRDAEEARLDADLTRQELAATTEELAHRVTASARVGTKVAVVAGAALVTFLVLRKLTHRRAS